MTVVVLVDGVLALVNAVELLLQFVPAVGDVHLDVVDVLGDALDAEVVGVVGADVGVGRFPALVVADVRVVADHVLERGRRVWVRRGDLCGRAILFWAG